MNVIPPDAARAVRLAVLVMAACLVVPWPALAQSPAPAVSARSWILVDPGREIVIDGHDPHARLAVASLTKVMTAVVALRFGTLTDEYAVDSRDLPGEASIGLRAGERFTLETLLYGMLMRSGNDAAAVIARGIGDRVATRRGLAVDGVALFIDLMNEQAAALGMINTTYRNPHGLDAVGHESSAYDVALLTRHALRDPTFRRMFGATSYPFRGGAWSNVNRLLTQYDGLVGGKTGVETLAGLCLVEVAQRDGRQLIVVVLNAPGWYDDARMLLDHGFTNSWLASTSSLATFGAAGPAMGPPLPHGQSVSPITTVGPAARTATPAASLSTAAASLSTAAVSLSTAAVSRTAVPPSVLAAGDLRGAADEVGVVAATVPAQPTVAGGGSPFDIVLALLAILVMAGVLVVVLSLIGIGPLAGWRSRSARRPGSRSWQTYQVNTDQQIDTSSGPAGQTDHERHVNDAAPAGGPTKPAVAVDQADEPDRAGIDDARPPAEASDSARLLDEHLTLAVRHAQAGRLDTAESFFVKAIQIAPDVRLSTLPDFWRMPPGGYVALALAYRRCGRLAQGRAIVGLGLVAFPEDADLRTLDRQLQAERRV